MTRTTFLGSMAMVVAFGSWGCASLIGLDKDYAEVEDGGGTDATGGASGSGACKLAPAPSICSLANMKAIPGGFCIDKTEVTWEEYLGWSNANPKPSTTGQAPFCEWNKSFDPAGAPPPGSPNAGQGNPVTNVDWCDAYAYCKAHQKQLCGAIDKTAEHADPAKPSDPCADQWYSACSSGGVNAYTYGETVVVGRCNADGSNQTTVPIKNDNYCQCTKSSYLGVYDMNGNVWEWVDSCSGYSTGPSAAEEGCDVRGGGYLSRADWQDDGMCAGRHPLTRQDTTLSDVGFRCCTKPE